MKTFRVIFHQTQYGIIHDMLGRIVEKYSDVTEQALPCVNLKTGIYFDGVIQNDNRQMNQIV